MASPGSALLSSCTCCAVSDYFEPSSELNASSHLTLAIEVWLVEEVQGLEGKWRASTADLCKTE